MYLPILTPRRPVRVAAIGAGAVALLGSIGCLCLIAEPAPGKCLLFAAGYGILLSGGFVGVMLASHLRVARWWAACYLLVLADMGAFWVVTARFPHVLLESIWVLKVIYYVIVGWLLSGCLVAVCGWWSYFRGIAGPASPAGE